MPTPISAYQKSSFSASTQKGHAITHDIYERGSGKICIIIQELPGIYKETLELADRFVDKDYKVVLPHLFGPIGKFSAMGNLIRLTCMRKEFSLLAKNASSPIVDWLKALCIQKKEENQVSGVAVIGMCLTGNFAISLMAEEAVLAAFASQPSLPFSSFSAIHESQKQIKKIKDRIDEIGPMHCGRFEKDIICRASKFENIRKTFNEEGKERIILHQLPGKGHSILTKDFVDEDGHPTKKALEDIMAYFDKLLS